MCSWHFPDGKAAGPSRFAWNEGKTFPAHLSHAPKKKKRKVPLPVCEDQGTDEPELHNADIVTEETPSTSSELHNADMIVTAQTPSTSSENAFNKSSVVVLEIENDMLRNENEKLKKELEKQKQTFSFSQISSNSDKVHYFTGLPDTATVLFVEALLSRFELNYHSGWTVQSIPLIDQLLLTLMKLRHNFGHVDLATRFNCSTATVTNIFLTIVSALYDIMYVGMLENNIPSLAKNQTSLPECFRPFPNCRIVLDCTEVAVCKTERLDTQSHLYSQYKGRTTHKTLIGVAPNGVITFVSDYYGGSTSDKAITKDSGVLEQLQPGDMVMADKGFTIRDILPEGVSLNIPSFLVNGQFTQEEVKKNKLISSARIHVERSIQRLKLFSILDNIPYQFSKNINKILKVCVCLTNLQTPILREIA